MSRKIIQLCAMPGMPSPYGGVVSDPAIYALCDDGSVWTRQQIATSSKGDLPGSSCRWGWKQLDTSDIATPEPRG